MKKYIVTRKSSKAEEKRTVMNSDVQDCTEYLDMLSQYFDHCMRDCNLLVAMDKDGTILIYEMVEVK